MKRLRAVLAAALTTGVLVLPHAGAEPRRQIVLTGSRSGWVDIATNGQLQMGEPVIEMRGRFGGFYVEQLESKVDDNSMPPNGGWVAIRGLSANPDDRATLMLGTPPQTRPGLLRFYLIADGPTTVRIDVQNGTNGTFRVKKPAQTQFRLTPLTQRDGVWSATAPFRMADRAVGLAAVQVTGERSSLADVTVCLRDRDADCPEPLVPVGGSAAAGDSGTGPLDPEQRWAHSPRVEDAPHGAAAAFATVEPVEPVSRAVLAAFTLALAR